VASAYLAKLAICAVVLIVTHVAADSRSSTNNSNGNSSQEQRTNKFKTLSGKHTPALTQNANKCGQLGYFMAKLWYYLKGFVKK